MPNTPIPDLWPEDIGASSERSPVTVLRQQASSLSDRTSYVITGEVVSTPYGNEMTHSFNLVAATLDNYRFRLLKLNHPIQQLYPVKIYSELHNEWSEAANESELIERLKVIFSSDETKRVVATLKASSGV